jgi:hypothetical protein
MTRRKSKREIERAIDELADGDHPPATLEDVLTADVVEFARNADADAVVWRLDGDVKTVPRSVAADAMRVWLEGEPKHADPDDLPDGALDQSVSKEAI